MKHFYADNGIGDADPEKIRAQARQLKNVVSAMDRTISQLHQVSVRGSWDSPSGDTFAAKVAGTPSDLIDVANRLRSAAAIIKPYADLLEASQKALTGYDDDAATADTTMKDCDRKLEAMGPDDPDRSRVDKERGQAAAAVARAERGFEKELQEARADEQRMAAKLRETSDRIDDPDGYDFWEGLSSLGESSAKAGIIAKPLALAGVADPIGKAGRRAFYDEGSYGDVAKAGAIYAADTVGFGAGRVVKAAKGRFSAKEVGRVNSLPAKPVRIKDNPIATSGRARRATTSTGRSTSTYAKKHYDPVPSKIPASVRDTLARKGGVDDVKKAFDDWEMVAGEGRVAKVSVVVEQSTKQGRRAYSNAKAVNRYGEETGIKDGAQERKEAQQEKQRNADRLAEGQPSSR